MVTKIHTLVLITFIATLSYAQNGPGGVGNASVNELWLKTDGGVYEDAGTDLAESGDNVYQWNDCSSFSRHIQQTNNVDRPEYIENALNGYPVIRFDASNSEFLGNITLDAFQNNYSIFMVGYTSGVTQDFVSITFDGDVNHGILIEATSSGRLRFLHRNPINTGGGDDLNAGSSRSTSQPQIVSLTRGTPSTGLQQFWINGTDNQSITASSPNFTSSDARLQIGRLRPGYTRYLDGDISEIILLSKEANTAERIIIENYLSAKYGLTLSSEDIYNEDNAGAGNFDHDVAGIGQAADGSNHTDSQGTGIIRVSNPRNLNNNEFLFWGEETMNPNYNFTSNTSTHTEQLNSRWRISRRSNVGRVDIAIDISGIDLSGKQSCAPLQLVFDDTYDFSSPEDIYDLTIVGSTATATNVRMRNNRYFTLRYVDEIVWDGVNYFNGSGTANAPDNTDACFKFTVKSGAASSINTDIHVRAVEVETGGVLNISNGNLLQVEDNVVINGNIDLIGEAQLIQNHSNTTANSGTGYLTKRQQGVGNLYNYNYWSSPVNTSGTWQIANLEDTSGVINFSNSPDAILTSPITLSSRWLYTFNAAAGVYANWAQITPTTPLSPGIGYTMKGSGAATEQEYIFKGIPNDGNYSYTVTAGNDFLVGNPYASALNADQFINDNLSVIDGTLYFWEHFNTSNSHFLSDYEGGYATYTLLMGTPAIADASGLTSGNGTASKAAPTSNIPVAQGFFVTTDNPGNLIFNNQQRIFARESLSQSVFYKNTSKKSLKTTEDTRPKIWFSFETPQNTKRILGLGCDVNTTYNYDKGYDALIYDELKNDAFWNVNDEHLVIQAVPPTNLSTDRFPLRIKVKDPGIYTFGINDLKYIPNTQQIYLKDDVENIFYNLRDGDASLVLNTPGEYNRFSVVFISENTLNTNENTITPPLFTRYNTENKHIELLGTYNPNTIKNVTIYNNLGQKILSNSKLESNTIPVEHLSDGLYIIKIKFTNTQSILSSKFIKH